MVVLKLLKIEGKEKVKRKNGCFKHLSTKKKNG